jgi:uncharacterized protein
MAVDVWMQHPTLRFLQQEMFESVRRWTDGHVPADGIPLATTVSATEEAGVEFGLLSAWHSPEDPHRQRRGRRVGG